ncbi:MAG: zinc ribbon domain-containing protein [Paludibacter sp.]|nr:zinc ribbon domain-containing protein [Paludibacter sp.]
MNCQKCNFQNEDTAKFCKNCGAKLSIPRKQGKQNKSLPYVIVGLLIAVVVGYLLFFNNSQANVNNDWGKFNLKGKVKSIVQNSYEVRSENDELTEKNKVYNGNLRDIKYWEYLYDEDELFEVGIDMDFFLRNSSGFEVKFNTAGNIDKYMFERAEILYKYDEKGNKIEEHWTDSYRDFDFFIKYAHNNNGQISEANIWGTKIIYRYDNDGNLISVKPEVEDRENPFGITYTYNDDKKISKMNNDNKNGNVFLIFEYNDNGDVSKLKSELKDNNSFWSIIWTYKYEYDEKGNWTKRYEYAEKIDLRMDYPRDWLKNLNGKKLILVTTREIQYY